MPFATSHFVASGRFHLISRLGQGRYSQVYLANDTFLNRMVVVKEVIPGYQGSADVSEKLKKEHRIQSRFDHLNIIKVYNVEVDPLTGEVYAFCEYASGGSLANLLAQRGPLSEREVVQVGIDICAALDVVFAKQIVHRDIKPSNLLLIADENGVIECAKLSDFGIAQDARERKMTTIKGGQPPLGTPLYMPPEQYDAMNILDVRSDLYALGITLWELLTGTDYKMLLALGKPVLRDHAPQASIGMGNILARLLEPDPNKRYQNPGELSQALNTICSLAPLHTLTNPSVPVAAVPKTGWRRWRHLLLVILILAIVSSISGLILSNISSVPMVSLSWQTDIAGEETTPAILTDTVYPTVNEEATQQVISTITAQSTVLAQITVTTYAKATATIDATATSSVQVKQAQYATAVAAKQQTSQAQTQQLLESTSTVTPQHRTERSQSYNGYWSGSTSQGLFMDFFVQDGYVKHFVIRHSRGPSCQSEPLSFGNFDEVNAPILNGRASWSFTGDFTITVIWKFPSPQSATGSFSLTETKSLNFLQEGDGSPSASRPPECRSPMNATWNANLIPL